MLVNEAEEDGRGDVFRAQGPRSHGGKEIQSGGLPAVRLRRGQIQARGVKEGGKGVRVRIPKGGGNGGAGRQDHLEAEALADLMQNFLAIDRFWPWRNAGQFDGVRLIVVANLRSALSHFAVEGLQADAQTSRFGLAGAVVLEGCEP